MKKRIIYIFPFLLVLAAVSTLAQSAEEGKKELLNPEEFIVIGHRGASTDAPEHSLESYRLAVESGADYIEIDLQKTKDGVLVAMHDDTVDRTTNGSGRVSDMRLSDIKKLDAGSWFNEEFPEKSKGSYKGLNVLTLEEIFQEFGSGVNYYIETKKPDKNKGMEAQLVSLLEAYELLGNELSTGTIVVQSFSEESLKKIHNFNKEIPLIKLENNEEVKTFDKAKLNEIRTYAIGVGASYQETDEEFLAAASDAGLLTHLYTVNRPEEVEALRSLGVNGVFSDNVTSVIPAISQ